eukprot:SAG25_NODE_13519_length_266_cov_0.616766_1_plen_48_part_01
MGALVEALAGVPSLRALPTGAAFDAVAAQPVLPAASASAAAASASSAA